MKKTSVLTITAALVLAVCVLSSGCVTPTSPEETIPDITGNWLIGTEIIYSSETGFTETATDDYNVLTCTEQKGRLVKLEAKDAQRTYYCAISDEDANSLFTDSSYGDIREYLTANIPEDGNAIVFASVSYNHETGEIMAIFDPRTKEGTAPSEKPKEMQMNLTGTWDLILQNSLINGTFIDVETTLNEVKPTFTFTVAEEKGPVFHGNIDAGEFFNVEFAGIVTEPSENGYSAVLIDSNGRLWQARFFTAGFVKLWEFTYERSGSFIGSADEISKLAVELPNLTGGKWSSESLKSLGNDGYVETDKEMDAVFEQSGDLVTAELSNNCFFIGKINPFGSIFGISADLDAFYTSNGFIDADGKLHVFTSVFDKESGLTSKMVERIYTGPTA